MKTTLYHLDIAAAETDGEGEDHSEWFRSLQAAKHRRAELVRMSPSLRGHRYGCDFAIHRIVTRDLSPVQLLLAALNHSDWFESREEVVPDYVPKPTKHRAEDDEED